MSTASKILELAANELGYSRWNDPQQGTKYGRWYADYTGASYFAQSGVPFCAMFVSYILNKAGVKCAGFPSAVAFDTHDNLQGRFVDKYSLHPGDPIAFDWDKDGYGDHVGFVEKPYATYVQTIEGNTGNGEVLRRTRSYKDIIGGVRPWYAAESSSETTPSTPSETGNQYVKQAQNFLMKEGFSVGATGADGYYGENTRAGLIKYVQTQLNKYGANIVVDGLNGYYTKNAWYHYGFVYYGSTRYYLVKAVQAALLCHGYSIGSAGIDGYCGSNTNSAIRQFQKDNDLDVDGVVGPITFAALF